MKTGKKNKDQSYKLGFTKLNYLFFVLGLLMILLGYLVMSSGYVTSFRSLTLAPILLFLGYIIFIPISLLISSEKD